jgi:hypothetical protein
MMHPYGVGADYDVEVWSAEEWGVATLPVLLEDVLEVGAPAQMPGFAERWANRLPSRSLRLPRIPTFGLIVAIIAGLGIAILFSGKQRTVIATPAPSPYSEQTPTLTLAQQAISSMVEIADSGVSLRDFQISDDVHPSCPRGAADAPDPISRIVATTQRYFPGYTVHDSARGIDLAGICSVEVREFSPAGSALLITVIAPPNDDAVPMAVSQANDRTTSIDVVVVRAGWRVEVGATGQTGEQPTVAEVTGLAEDSRLVW